MTRQQAGSSDGSAGAAPSTGRQDGRALAGLLARHCAGIDAEGAAVLRAGRDGRVEILAVHPPARKDVEPPDWLRQALVSTNDVLAGGAAAVRPLHEPEDLYSQPARRYLAMIPVVGGVVAFAKATGEPDALLRDVERTHEDVPALELYGLCATAHAPRGAVPRLEPVLALLAAVNEHDRFLAAAMALCNELAARWRCERASLGLLRGRYVELAAMSHTEKFSRRMRAVQLIEAAMEECLDQDIEVVYPAEGEADFVCRDARELSADGGPTAVLSVPLRRAGHVEGVVTLQRVAENPFDAEEVESLRLACELCSARLIDLRRRDRWIGAKAAEGVRRGLAVLLGAKHTWAKLLVGALLAGALTVALATGDYRIEAPCVLEATTRQVLLAPFDGQIASVNVIVGDKVSAGDVLATLRTVGLKRKRNAARAEQFEYRKQADAARAQKRWAEAQMASAKARQLAERIELLDDQIARAEIKALIAGTVVVGDMERFVGASVEKGQVLFEVSPIRSLRAELAVPEDQIADLLAATRAGEVRGALAAESYPQRRVDFVVERIRPLGDEADDEVVFRVRARLSETPSWMRPGMEGLARIGLGRRRVAWLWSRRLVNRLRLWFWW